MNPGSTGPPTLPADVGRILRLLPDAHLVTGVDGTIRHANPAAEQLLGRTSDGLVGGDLATLLATPASLPALLGRWSRSTAPRPGILELGDGARLRCDGARLSGDALLLRLRERGEALTPFERVNHRVDTANLRELSRRLEASVEELRESNIRLATANEEVQQYARAVAHDIRTPLFTVQAYARLIEEDGHVDATGAEYVRFILESTERLAATTDAMLEVARLEREVRSGGPTDTVAALEQVIADIGEEIRGPDVTVTAGELLPAAVEPTAFRRVLQNLLVNGVRHGQVPGRPLCIEVTSRRLGADVVFAVCDDGAGIGEDDPAALFELFRRGVGAAEVPGIGIGLPTCRKIVHAWGGTIACEPLDGPGTCFTFTAPGVRAATRGRPRPAPVGGAG